MNKLIIALSAISLFAFSCGSDSGTTKTDLAPNSFDSLINAADNAQIVDVRTPEEFSGGHIAGAVNYDWNDDAKFTQEVKGLDKSKPVMVYCRSGNRSSQAAQYLRQNGFTVYELEGGITSWEKEGKPVTKVDESVTASAPTETHTVPHDGPVSVDQYNQIIAGNKVVLVDFTATWCGPCKMLAPSLHELETELSGKFVLLKVDVDRDRPVAEVMNIMAMPTLVLYKDGQVQWRNEGLVPKDMIAAKINSVQ